MPTFDQLPCPALVTDRAGVVQLINQSLLQLVGGVTNTWFSKPMDLMFPGASRIFLQTHVWPMVLREGQVREIRLQVLGDTGNRVPVFVNCQRSTIETTDSYTWVFFVTVERSRYEQELLEAKQRAEAISAELAKSDKFIRTVADALPSLISRWDLQMQCQFANKPFLQWFGRTPQDMVGLSLSTMLGASLFEKNLAHIQGVLAGERQEFERAIARPDGSVGYVLTNYIPDIDPNGQVQGFFVLATDITGLREADAAIRLSASVFEATAEGIMVTDTAATIVSVNSAFTALTGYTSMEVVGVNARILKSGRHDAAFFGDMFAQLQATKLWKGEVWSKRKDGSIFLARLSISSICNEAGDVSRYVGVIADITEHWDKEQLVQHMALHDGLTGLANRTLLMERLSQLIAKTVRESRNIALMFLDLDGFKSINDTYGHEVGDLALKTVSARLLGLLRNLDTVARLGGDEFLILLDNPESCEKIAMVASRVIEVVNGPMNLDGTTVHVGTSIGIATFQNDGMSATDLLKRADDAMYVAKKSGKNSFRFSG
ncbi:MAG: diguanylate cyclase [Rhodoferax sp.]|uniref:sensor domain-containing protein n=1 Tax=Rhodoferax sp. TaxID=50421 RepID=UPI00260D2A25|nr:diguanylate cyclase [Rhodoferax sp.]MDD2879346.1 diguanylate cyclase [Rhodoferax sp.]